MMDTDGEEDSFRQFFFVFSLREGGREGGRERVGQSFR
jgi:hypothetical protein